MEFERVTFDLPHGTFHALHEHRLLLAAIRRWGSVDAERDSAPVTSAGPGSS